MDKKYLDEARELKRLAFFGVAMAAMTSFAAIIAGPMLFNYVQYVQSSLQEEVEFCSQRTHGLWGEYEKVIFDKIIILGVHMHIATSL